MKTAEEIFKNELEIERGFSFTNQDWDSFLDNTITKSAFKAMKLYANQKLDEAASKIIKNEIDELTHQYLHKIDMLDNGTHKRNSVNNGAIVADIILLSGEVINKQNHLIEKLEKELRLCK